MIKGLDMSSYNEDYRDEAEGCDWLVVKAGENANPTNEMYDEQIEFARNSGAVVGTYYWLRPGSPVKQARWYVDKARPRPGEFLVCDFERQNPDLEDRDPTFEEVKEFIAEVKRLAPDNKVGLYCNLDFWRTRANQRLGGADFLWLAWYTSDRERVEDLDEWLFWQYMEAPDYNRARFDSRADMLRWAGGNVVDTPVYQRPRLRERVSWRGRLACTCMIESIEKVVEPRLKAAGVIKYSIDIFQAAYSHASASANTHAGGGAIDVDQFSDTAVRIWREAGWAFWRRGRDYRFMPHGHGVLIGCPHLSDDAEDQIDQYRAGDNGLYDHARDPHLWMDIDPIDWDDAIREYLGATAPAAGGGSGPTYDDDIEEFLMTARFDRHRCSKPQKLGRIGKWQYLYITDENNISLSDGPARILGHVYVHMNLAQGQSAYFRVVEDEQDSNGKTSRRYTYEDHEEISGTGGGTYKKFPLTLNAGGPSKGKTANFVRIQWHSSDPDAEIIRCGVHRYDGK